jgi:succinate-acetate transporter protein
MGKKQKISFSRLWYTLCSSGKAATSSGVEGCGIVEERYRTLRAGFFIPKGKERVMSDGILCSFYGKDEDICDVGCGYISPSDVAVIIKFCSANYRACSKYQELIDRYPQGLDRERQKEKVPATPASPNSPPRQLVAGQPLVKPFKVRWPLPSLWRHVSTRTAREQRAFAGGLARPGQATTPPLAKPAVALANGTARPAPLGLLGFGMAAVLVNLNNAGFPQLSAFMLAIGIFYGGLAQIITGFMEWRNNNTFGATAFISYGLFWLTLVALVVMSKVGMGHPPSSAAVVAYLSMWGIFTATLFVGSFRLERILRIFFGFLTLLFLLLAIASATGSDAVRLVAGWQGIITGAIAIYGGLAQVVKEAYQRRAVAA